MIAALFNTRFGGGRTRPEQFHPYLRHRRPSRGIPITKGVLAALAIALRADGAPPQPC